MTGAEFNKIFDNYHNTIMENSLVSWYESLAERFNDEAYAAKAKGMRDDIKAAEDAYHKAVFEYLGIEVG